MLSNSIVRLRPPELSDLEYLYQWENNVEIWKVSNTLVPFSSYAIEQYIRSVQQDIYSSKQMRLMIVKNNTDQPSDRGEPIGCIDLFEFDPANQRAGVGILIASAENRGKGYASAALTIVINYAKEILRLHQLYCTVFEDNEASMALFTNNNFEITGHQRDWVFEKSQWKDVNFLQLILND